MISDYARRLNSSYPRNYVLNNPLVGALVITAFYFIFSVLYKPLGVHAAEGFSYGLTMAFYSCFSGAVTYVLIRVVSSLKWFSDKNNWTLFKEFTSILLILIGIGIAIYLMGFIIESSSERLNIATLLDSLMHALLIGIIPFLFFTLINYPKLQISIYQENHKINKSEFNPAEVIVNISSQLKKESLKFLPDELIYAESDGNYVVFFLEIEKQVRKEIIRNSINNIEEQLSGIPFVMRTHRAFIVNIKRVCLRQGTTLGYTLKLSGTESRVPVSRNNTRKFNQLLTIYRN